MASCKLTQQYWRHFFAFILLIFSCSAVFSQRLNTTIIPKFYSVNDGLSDRLVTDIVQSRDGFIWLATYNGLNKFDGYEFVVFNDDFNNPNRISNSNIEKLLLSKDEKLLITYQNKISYFDLLDPYTHLVTKVNLSNPENGIKGIVRQISTNKKGDILVLATTQKGTFLHLYTSDNQFKTLFEIQEERKKQSVAASILQLRNGNYLLNDSEKGLRLVSASGKIIKTFYEKDFSVELSKETYPGVPVFMHEDQKGRVWLSFGQHTGVFLFSEKDNTFQIYSRLPSIQNYSQLWEDQQGNLLFAHATGNGNYPDIQNLYCLQSNGILVDFSHLVALVRVLSAFIVRIFTKPLFWASTVA
ncbi:MAG: hypothetical protein IPJ74_23545 [Saprospiraceae bacterium]|nr:hypothetical protein [Saprospiraceae bacterium]